MLRTEQLYRGIHTTNTLKTGTQSNPFKLMHTHTCLKGFATLRRGILVSLVIQKIITTHAYILKVGHQFKRLCIPESYSRWIPLCMCTIQYQEYQTQNPLYRYTLRMHSHLPFSLKRIEHLLETHTGHYLLAAQILLQTKSWFPRTVKTPVLKIGFKIPNVFPVPLGLKFSSLGK